MVLFKSDFDGKSITSGGCWFCPGYTYAELDFVPELIFNSLDNQSNGLNSLGDGTYSTVILDYLVVGELTLSVNWVQWLVFTTLDFNEADFYPDVTFRRIGILKDPTFRISQPATATGSFAINVTDYGGPASYTVGERLGQVVTVGGVAKNAFGTVVAYDTENNVVRYIQDPTIHADGDGNTYAFSGDGYVNGLTSGKSTKPTTFSGTLVDTSFSAGYSSPEANKYSGEMIYLSNVSSVTIHPIRESITVISSN